MEKEEIKAFRRRLEKEQREGSSNFYELQRQHFSPLFKGLIDECNITEHEYRQVYYDFGSFSDRSWNTVAKRCKWCNDLIFVEE